MRSVNSITAFSEIISVNVHVCMDMHVSACSVNGHWLCCTGCLGENKESTKQSQIADFAPKVAFWWTQLNTNCLVVQPHGKLYQNITLCSILANKPHGMKTRHPQNLKYITYCNSDRRTGPQEIWEKNFSDFPQDMWTDKQIEILITILSIRPSEGRSNNVIVQHSQNDKIYTTDSQTIAKVLSVLNHHKLYDSLDMIINLQFCTPCD